MSKHGPTYNLGNDFRQKIKEFSEKFLTDGFKMFEKEFGQIETFVERAKVEPEDRDAHTLRLTDKRKYLLEAVYFYLYDQMNREAFNKTKDTLIVMPDCLSLDNTACEKVETKFGDVCKRCLETCNAYNVTELAGKYKAKVIFSKRKLTEQLEHYRLKSGDLGVIGVACLLMLANGMRTAADVDVPARGVLLNCTGCEHWNDQPFGSAMSLEWLEDILREKDEFQNQNP